MAWDARRARLVRRWVDRLCRANPFIKTKTQSALSAWLDESEDHRQMFFVDVDDNYQFERGRDISKGKWSGTPATSLTTINAFRMFCIPRMRKVNPTSYLEFGAACGTTLLLVAECFPEIAAIGIEPLPKRKAIFEAIRARCPFDTEKIHWITGVFEDHVAELRRRFPTGIDVIYMDTNHKYPNDLNYLNCILVDEKLLAPGGLLICDDRYHTGTAQSVNEFLEKQRGQIKFQEVAGRWGVFFGPEP